MLQPKPTISIEVKITNRCNQACIHCANSDGLGSGQDIDWKLFNLRVEDWARQRESSVYDLNEIRLTGGEPLVDFEAVAGLARGCQRLGIRSGINTNGLLLDSGRIRLLKESGVGVFKISFDSIRLATYGRMRGRLPSLQPFFSIIQDLVKNRFKVILRLTLTRDNRDQLISCYHKAVELGVAQLQIKPLIRSGRAARLDSFLNRDEVNEALLHLAEASAGAGLPVEILCWPPVAGSPLSFKVCGSANKIYVSTDLTCSICNFIGEDRSTPLGDLSTSPLEDIFRRRTAGQWIKQINGHRLVQGCPNEAVFERDSA